MIGLQHIYSVYRSVPKDDGTDGFDRRLLATYALHGNNFESLSDYDGALSHIPNGPLDASSVKKLQNLSNSIYSDVVSKEDIRSGKRLDLLPETPSNGEFEPMPENEDLEGLEDRPESVFDYFREGMDRPHKVHFQMGNAYLDNNRLEEDESRKIIDNVQQGVATLRYRKPESTMQKFEKFFAGLEKSEDLNQAVAALKSMAAAGKFPQEHFDEIRRGLFQDEMIPSLGNKKAHRDFLLNSDRGGVHMALDMNQFATINNNMSHTHGDNAIIATGNALRNAIDSTVGSEHAKAFRTGGDEFVVHVPTHEHAAQVLRKFRENLDAIPPIGGVHKLSASVGMGISHEMSEESLKNGAKAAKDAHLVQLGGNPEARKIYTPGLQTVYAHSLVPGHIGHVPTEDQVPEMPPELPTPLDTGLAKSLTGHPKNGLYEQLAPGYEKAIKSKRVSDSPAVGQLSERIKNAPITINLPFKRLKQISDDEGQILNGFQTGTTSAADPQSESYDNYFSNRMDWEAHQLDIPENARRGDRPIYGTVHIGHDSPHLGAWGGSRDYGEVALELKPDVKKRATMTPDDTSDPRKMPVFLADQHHRQLAQEIVSNPDRYSHIHRLVDNIKNPDSPLSHGYIEAQIHGQLDLPNDVNAIHLTPDFHANYSKSHTRSLMDQAIKIGRAHGIPVYSHQQEMKAGRETGRTIVKTLHDPSPSRAKPKR